LLLQEEACGQSQQEHMS